MPRHQPIPEAGVARAPGFIAAVVLTALVVPAARVVPPARVVRMIRMIWMIRVVRVIRVVGVVRVIAATAAPSSSAPTTMTPSLVAAATALGLRLLRLPAARIHPASAVIVHRTVVAMLHRHEPPPAVR